MQDLLLARFPGLRYRDFRIFWFGQFISIIGSQMQIVALNWQIYILTHSPLALGIIGLVRVIPIICFSLIGGSFADSVNRKKMLFITQSILGILSLILAVTSITGIANPILIYTITALAAATLSFDMPAKQAMVPNLVDKKHLSSAMSLNVIMFQTSMMVGPALAGILIGQINVGGVYVIDAISYLTVIIALFLIKNSGSVIHATEKTPVVSFDAIKEGVLFVRSKTMLWSTMLLDFFGTFFASATALLPIFATKILHVGPEGLGLLYSAPAIGAVLTGLVFSHFHHLRKQGIILLSAVTLYGIATIIFGLSEIFLLSFIALIIAGASDSISTIIRNTVRQLVTPDHLRGRMSSVMMIFYMGGPQLGEFEAGALAAAIGAPLSVVVGGTATLAIVGAMSFIKKLRTYDTHPV